MSWEDQKISDLINQNIASAREVEGRTKGPLRGSLTQLQSCTGEGDGGHQEQQDSTGTPGENERKGHFVLLRQPQPTKTSKLKHRQDRNGNRSQTSPEQAVQKHGEK